LSSFIRRSIAHLQRQFWKSLANFEMIRTRRILLMILAMFFRFKYCHSHKPIW